MTLTCDVLVVGLGPGGAAAAAAAAGARRRVLAIDRKQRIGEPVQCAEFVPDPLVGLTRDDGVLVQRIRGMKSNLPSGAVEQSPLPGLMVDRGAFDRALAKRAAARGAVIGLDAHLVALDSGRQTAVVRRGDMAEERVGYEVLIAADGPHSITARLLGLPPLRTVQTRQYTVPLNRAYADTDVWLSDAYPGGYGWLFPKGTAANVGLGADRRFSADLKASLDRLHDHLVRQGLVGREIIRRTGGPIPVGGMRASLVYANVLFVGDAAGLTHPITGAGIAAAVQSGEQAGAAAAEYLATRDPARLAAYEEEMREQYGAVIGKALERRAYLSGFWRRAAANDDGVQRRGWIGFREYFE